jgi:hypothetical protein
MRDLFGIFETLGLSHMVLRAEGFKDTEKIPHIEGNEFANTFLE